MSYKSKYTGKQVDDLLTQIEEGDLDITIDQELSSESSNAISNSAVTNAINELPNEDGYYPSMSVGMADNLVGRGDVQDAQINFRPSGGELGVGNGMNISDAAARIEKIKGNSVVWNNFGGGFTAISVNTGILHEGAYMVQGHKYLFYRTNTSGTLVLVQKVDGIEKYDCKILEGRNYVFYTALYSLSFPNISLYNPDGLGEIIILTDLTQMFGAGNEPTTVEEYYQRKPMNIENEFAYNDGELIDMKVDSLISTSDNAYDYVKGYARVMGGHTYDCSYGTAFVEKVYFSTDKDNIVAEENAMTSENGKYTFPSDGYAVPYTTDGDVREYCVCLQHTYTKPHPPHQQDVKDISFIGGAFPEGMRLIPPMTFPNSVVVANVGGLYDEIFFDKTIKKWKKVQRIGVAYAKDLVWGRSGNNLFSALIADLKRPTTYEERREGILTNKYTPSYPVGVNALDDKSFIRLDDTKNLFVRDNEYDVAADFAAANQDLVIYYELAEPIVEEIDLSPNFNPNYLAWDFGTEEAIASVPSAPFRADINYEPNAVDDLRWAIGEIRSLRTQLAQLQSVASETNLTE